MIKLKEIPKSRWLIKEAGSIRGHSDILGCVNGRFVALEVKRSYKEASKNTGRIALQKKFLTDYYKVGAFTAMVYPENLDFIINLLKELVENPHLYVQQTTELSSKTGIN